MLKKKLVIVEDNAITADMLKEVIGKRPDWQVVGTVGDGLRSAEIIRRTRPDLVLLDLLLPGCDGFSVMEAIRGENLPCKFFVLSGLREENFMAKALKLGASFYLTKPFDTKILMRRIDDLFAEAESSKRPLPPRRKPVKEWEGRIKARLNRFFLDLGISVVHNGYKFLRSAILLCVNDPDLLNNVSANVYPKVAKMHGVKSCIVEHGCRYSLEKAWHCGRPDLYCDLFASRAFEKYRPTNGEFLRMMTEQMLTEFPRPDEDTDALS